MFKICNSLLGKMFTKRGDKVITKLHLRTHENRLDLCF